MKCPFSSKTEIGWLRANVDAAAIYFPPERVVKHAQASATPVKCPAFQDAGKNRFVIRAPFDIHLTIKNGKPDPVIHDSTDNPMKFAAFVLDDKTKWFDPEKPVLQMKLAYCFVSDTPGVRMRLTPAYEFYEAQQLPGTVLAGEFDIYDWALRNVNFAMEWQDLTKDLILKRGDPLFCVEFHNVKHVEIVPLYPTPNILAVMKDVSNVTAVLAKGTRTLMKLMGKRRPKKIIPLGKLT